MKLHHQITGSHLEGQAKSGPFEREIKKPLEKRRGFLFCARKPQLESLTHTHREFELKV